MLTQPCILTIGRSVGRRGNLCQEERWSGKVSEEKRKLTNSVETALVSGVLRRGAQEWSKHPFVNEIKYSQEDRRCN